MSDKTKMVADSMRGSWVHKFLPERFWPYAQLARWERPIGWQLLLWPCWWSAMLAHVATVQMPASPVEALRHLSWESPIPWYLLLLFVGAFAMRGAGCTYNDVVDEDIDAKVARTRSRPLPSGRVTKKQAAVFLLMQLFVGLIVLLQFNTATIITGFISIVTIVIYPFMKRITWWPQLFLGFAFSWGALVGWTAVTGALQLPAILLYLGCICWVIAYDTIYAHQDIEDDALVGVKSTARLFADRTRPALAVLYGVAIAFWAVAFYVAQMPSMAWIGLAVGAAHLAWQVMQFELNNPGLSLKLFKSNNTFGWIMFAGLLAAALV